MTQNAEPALSAASQARLAAWLPRAIGARSVEIVSAEKLAGGAVQENWRIDVDVSGGARHGRHRWVLRTDSPARLSMSLDRLQEFECLRVAAAAGVLVAEPIARCDDRDVIGRPFLLQAHLQGTAQGRRIVRDPDLGTYGRALALEVGRQMALLHAIAPPRADLAFLAAPGDNPAKAAVRQLRAMLDECSQPRPALEFVLCWLDANAPMARRIALVHGDLRTGNVMVDGGRLTGILDWEFCHWGDAREDIGWFCARCWRFGNDDREAGGIAEKADLLDGYNAHAPHPVAIEEIPYWEVLAAARWGAIAALQGDRFLKGGERSLELALTGLMPAEMEVDALQLIAEMPGRSPDRAEVADTANREGRRIARYKTIGPEALLDLAAEALRAELLPALPADKRYAAAMIANAIDVAGRGLDENAESVRWELLDSLYDDGEGSLVQLARDIRSGAISTRTHADLAHRLMRLLVSELRITNPRFLVSRFIAD